jgi:PAS domain S-box-containing protein
MVRPIATHGIRVLFGELHSNEVEPLLRSMENYWSDIKLEIASNIRECLKKLNEKSYDLLLLDYEPCQMNAIDILNEVIRNNFDIPVVIVSGEGDEELAVKAMKMGAYDYVVKNEGYPRNLPPILSRAIKKYRSDKEKEKLYEEIRSLKDYMEKIYNTVADPIYVMDNEGRFVDLNKMGENLTGYKKEELLGMRFTELLAPEYLEKTMKRFKRRLQGEDFPPYEIEIITKDGRRVPLEIRATRLEGVGEIGIARDITEQKRLEEELREHASELERSNTLKGLFIDIMGHDLLNSLTVIRGVVNLLTKEKELQEYKKHLSVIENNVERLIETLENVQVYMKLRGAGDLNREEVDLTGVAMDVIQEYRATAATKGIEIIWRLPEKSPAKVSPFIRHVFDNLISNAIKYSPDKGRVEVEIMDAERHYEIRVKDQGLGIPDEYKEVIFQRFERGGKKGVKGTGLGLAIVKRVVELHEGRVRVTDNIVEHTTKDGRIKKKKKGSVFSVTIPKL